MNVETNRVKERLFYMSCFDRFTKVKRNGETEQVHIIIIDWQLPILLREKSVFSWLSESLLFIHLL